jgi:hypothetical protein
LIKAAKIERFYSQMLLLSSGESLDNIRHNPVIPITRMKKHLFLILMLVWCAAAATNDLSPSQQTKKPAVPSSNAATNNNWVFRFSPDGKAIIRGTNSISAAPPKFISKMPVITPKPGCDVAMIKTPDSSNDYKLIIKRPDVEVVK